jgi:hypothetical protein
MAVSIVAVAYVWSPPNIEESINTNAEKTAARIIYIPRLEFVLLPDKVLHKLEKYLT